MKNTEISRAALGRIPVYLKYLRSLPPNTENISATSVATGLGFGEVQVRKDLGALCGLGKPRTGYNRAELVDSLQRYLKGGSGGAVIVGAGKLGKALLDYTGFESYGISILAAFDKKASENEYLSGGKPILPMESLGDFCAVNDVKLGIIAVPSEAAQEVCNLLYDNGIKAMWCFAPCQLYKPADAVIQYENLALSLAHLKMQLKQS